MFVNRIFAFCTLLILLILPFNGALAAEATPVVIVRVKLNGLATGTCGGNWANACTLEHALTNTTAGQEFWVAAGTYSTQFALKSGVAFYGGFTGTETSRTQRNWKDNVTKLSGVTVTAFGVDTTSILDGFTISDAISQGFGGGIALSNNASPTLTNLIIKNNHAQVGGGLSNDSGSPILTNITFYGNTASGSNVNWGGGMYSGGGNPKLTNVVFRNNKTEYCCGNEGAGGGMYIVYGSPTLTNVVFDGNKADLGGGLYAHASSYIVNNATFSNNSAVTGGAIYHEQQFHGKFFNTTIIGNTAINGGGIFTLDGQIDITNATISGNAATDGGAIYGQRGSVHLINGTITLNSATHAGNAIYTSNLGGLKGYVQLKNSIVADNGSQANFQISSLGSFSAAYSIITGGCPNSGSNCQNLIVADPKLGALGNYGGFSQTIPLLSDSPAIDAGDNTICPSIDQRGILRPQGSACDLGAYEGSIATTISTFSSIAAHDGWVLESNETSNVGGSMNAVTTTVLLGDNTIKNQLRNILSFKTSTLPDTAVITGVVLKIKKQDSVGTGDPLTIFQGFMIDIKNGFFGSSAVLQEADFQGPASRTLGATSPAPVDNWYSINLINGKDYINKLTTNSGLTQIRLRFKLDDNNDAVANYLSLFSGNAAAVADRPQLQVTYYVP